MSLCCGAQGKLQMRICYGKIEFTTRKSGNLIRSFNGSLSKIKQDDMYENRNSYVKSHQGRIYSGPRWLLSEERPIIK